MSTLPDKPTTLEESEKQLKIPEPFLESIQVYQNQVNEVAKTVSRAIMPISPALTAIQRFAESANEIRTRLQPLLSLKATQEFTLPSPQLRYQMPQHQRFPSTGEIAEEVVKKIEERKGCKTSEKITVYLSKDNDLYTSAKHRYPLQSEKARLNLVRTLSYQYKPTKELLIVTGYKNAESLYKTMSAINAKVRYLLKIKADLIEGRRGSGYRINQKIKLVRL